MHLPVTYAQNIIVGVIFGGEWHWYVTERDVWVLDMERYEQAYVRKGYQVPDLGQYSERFGIGVVNRDTATQFLNYLNLFMVSTEEVRTEFLTEHREGKLADGEWHKFIPSLLVDFDSQRLLSLYPEPFSFEDFVPAGWTGSYENFLSAVPLPARYWVCNGVNYFETQGS